MSEALFQSQGNGVVQIFLNFLNNNYEISVFLGTFLFGEVVILLAFSLVASKGGAIGTLFFLTLCAALLADFFWYFVGHNFLHSTERWTRFHRFYSRISEVLDKMTNKRPFLILLVLKFFYGMRLVTITYLGSKRIPLRIFLLYDTFGTMLWIGILGILGWLAGKGIPNVLSVYKDFQHTFLAVLAVFLLFELVSWWFRKKVMKI